MYIPINLKVLWKAKALFLLCVAGVMWGMDRRVIPSKGNRQPHVLRWITEFAILGTGPIILFHLIYFFPESRFYLPMVVLVTAMIGGILGGWLQRLPRSVLLWGVLALVLLCVYHKRSGEPGPLSYRQWIVNEILQYTPEDSWIISGIESSYLEYMVARESQRRVVPISRRMEYAGKLITPKKIPHPNPPPQNWQNHRCLGLLRGGAHEAIRFVASEQLDSIADQLSSGTRVFVSFVTILPYNQPILEKLEKRFLFVPKSASLIELKIKI
jgi:hypothetical protein